MISGDVDLLMMDSGAFSVWNAGSQIDLDAYIEFCKEYLDVIDLIVALDVIPGRPGDKSSLTRQNIESSCEQGWLNYQKMIKAGLPVEKVIPVFHQNDDFKWLKRFIRRGVPYFGISPANDRTSYQRQLWLDTCMRFVCDDKGMPKAKFHGFAVTSIPLMVRYPWYSCDSASWLKFAIYGSLMIPERTKDGSWNFLKPPQRLFFSSRIGENASERGMHFENMPPARKQALQDYLNIIGAPYGKSTYRKEDRKYKPVKGQENIFKRGEDFVEVETIVEAGVSNTVEWRCYVNKYFMDRVEEHLSWPRPFKFMGRGLL